MHGEVKDLDMDQEYKSGDIYEGQFLNDKYGFNSINDDFNRRIKLNKFYYYTTQ